MRKAVETLFTLALAVTSVWHLGCAVTDYEQGPLDPPLNQSHGLIACESGARFASSQQTFEIHTRELFHVLPEVGEDRSVVQGCLPPPAIGDEPVSRHEAREWNRFLGAFSWLAELQYRGPLFPDGTWVGAGIKGLPDGSRRLNSFYFPSGELRPCALTNFGASSGGPEGLFAAERYTQPGETGPRIPGFRLNTVAIDSEPGAQFCRNLVAMHPDHIFENNTVLISAPARRAEWRLQFTPLTRRSAANQSRLLFGGEITVHWEGIDVVIEAELQNDGDFGIDLLSLSSEKQRYVAERPIRIALDPSSGFRRISIDGTGRAEELRRLSRFALDEGLGGREIELGQELPELALRLPDMSLFIPLPMLERVAFHEPAEPQR